MQLYDKLLGLPLFQGLSSSDLQNIVSHVKFGFLKYNKGQIVVDEDMPCKGLLFVLDGELEMLSTPADHSFVIAETPHTPIAIEPERIFGLYQRYARRYVAKSQCHCIFVGKDDVMHLATEYVVFRLNLLNIISTLSQRSFRQLWSHQNTDDESRVVNFFKHHCALPSGQKVIRIKMQQLADCINVARLDVSNVLNKLDSEGKIILQRGIITIPKLELL